MSYEDENKLLKMVIETQASRIADQEATIKELRSMVDELRSLRGCLKTEIYAGRGTKKYNQWI